MLKGTKSVLVAHPTLQHSHQLACALYEKGWLTLFISGTPVINQKEVILLPNSIKRFLKKVPIPPHFRKHPYFFAFLVQLVGKITTLFSQNDDPIHFVYHLFDWWVSRKIKKVHPNIVVGYENSSYYTFKEAKRIGAICVLDASSIHHIAGSRLMSIKATSYRKKINQRKDEEIALADIILTCSPLAADTYIEAGVLSTKVKSVLLGSERTNHPENTNFFTQNSHRNAHFVFAGGIRYLKAVDIILDAFRKVHKEDLPYDLTFIGGVVERKWLIEIEKTPHAVYRTTVPQHELYTIFSRADCLLLPSRFDSFGMVAIEAMASGTPAIVSDQTGVKAIIEKFPGSGWIIKCDVDSLYHCVKSLITNRQALLEARAVAQKAANHFTWETYRRHIKYIFESL